MKRLGLVFAALSVAVIFLAYSPITISVNIDTSAENSEGPVASNGTGGEAQAATRTGTDGNDTLTGTGYRDFLDGRGGDDTLRGASGKDVIQGDGPRTEGGDDLPGDDTIYGNDGGDNINGGDGVDKIYGGSGDDVITTLDYSEGDFIDCGGGYGDFAFIDPSDQTKNCENVVDDRWFAIQGT